MARFLSSLLLLLFFTSCSYAALVVDVDFSSSAVASSATGIPFYFNDNVTIIGQFTVQCNPGGTADVSASINIHIEIQISYSLTDIYVWLGAAGTFPTKPHRQWDTSSAGGVTKVFSDLTGTTFDLSFTLEEYATLLESANGVIAECFRVAVVIDVKQFCGGEHLPASLIHSPKGCDYSFEALYPSVNSYFQVAIQPSDSGPIPVGNSSVLHDGWCIKPTVYINANTPYQGQIFSSYDPFVLNSAPGLFVEYPQNFPAVNYIINNECRYTSPYLSGYQCSWQDIQNAIWTLLYPSAILNDPSLLLPQESQDCCNWIVGEALANANYTPPCPGGRHLEIVYPILPGHPEGICILDNGTQIIVYITDYSCTFNCRIRHCHYKGIYGGGHGCHSKVQSNFEETLVFDVCLETQCLPTPTASLSPSLTSQPVHPPPPPPSTTSTASYSSVPSASNTPCASTTNTASSSSVPSASNTPCVSTTNTASYSSVPSASNTPCVSTTNTASHSSVPSASSTSTASHTPHPSFSPCPPSQSHTPYPSHSPCHDMPSASPSPTMCAPGTMGGEGGHGNRP